jgi:RNA polymerase sigma-70 factor (ECF subfamily)
VTNDDGTARRAAIEVRVVAALDDGDHEGAVTLVVREYGPEVLRFIMALHRDQHDAGEVFSMFAEALWSSLPRFERRSSVRTFAYAIARRSSLRYRRDRKRRDARHLPLPDDSALSILQRRVRTETLSWMRTERRSRLKALRDALPPEDQVLLMLRVDRQLSWEDLARVIREGEEEPLSDDLLKRECARLRKRFQLLKDRLREKARRQGLLGPRGET